MPVRRSRNVSSSSLRRIASVRATCRADARASSCRRGPSSEPSSATNASSRPRRAGARDQLGRSALRDDAPLRQHDDAVAQRRDFLHHVRREEQALALRAQRAQLVAQRPHAHDVEAVRRFVEQDRVGVVHERARDRRPSSSRPAKTPRCADRRSAARPSVANSASMRCSSARAGKAVQRAVIADVLARGQARVEAARIRQHADAAAHRVAVGDDVETVDARACRRPGSTSVAIIRNSVVLPAPLGPSRPVIAPSGASNVTPRTAVHFAPLAERLGDAVDRDHGCGARRSGHEGGRFECSRKSMQAAAASRNLPCRRTPR